MADEVQLDLEPGHRLVVRERMLAQHDRERVEAALHLGAVALAIPSTERPSVDVLAHACAASRPGRAPSFARCSRAIPAAAAAASHAGCPPWHAW
jgi:hypothetical protein